MGMIDDFVNPASGYNAASDQMHKSWDQTQSFERPYWQNGLDQYGRLNTAENNLLDPETLQNKWAGNYSMSPYALSMQRHATNAGLDAASSMGLMGSSAAVGNIQQSAGDIMQSDRQQYMNDLMQKYMTGIGIGQNIYNTGAQMAGIMGNQSQDYGQNMGRMAYGRATAGRDMYGKMTGIAGDMALNYATGGMPAMARAANSMVSGGGYTG